MTEAKMMGPCQEMKAQKAKMKADMKAHDAQLTEQLAGMNRAPQNQKTDLMAAVVTQMVEQRIAMDARKAKDGGGDDEAHDAAHADRQGIHGAVPDDEGQEGQEGQGRKICG